MKLVSVVKRHKTTKELRSVHKRISVDLKLPETHKTVKKVTLITKRHKLRGIK